MGQAKRRGNFEERKAQGIARRAAEEEAALERHRERKRQSEQREAERQAAMSDEEREAERNRRRRGRRALAMAGVLGATISREAAEIYDPIVIDGDSYRSRR